MAVAPGVMVEDGALWQAVILAAGAAALAALQSAQNPRGVWDELARRFEAVEPLEVRLDVTTLWCYALGRDLVRQVDWNNPFKLEVHLGFSDEQVAHLMDLVGSSSALCVAWIASGIVTRQFERRGFNGTLPGYMRIGWATGLSAGLVWQLSEQYLYSAARPDLLEAVPLDWSAGFISIAALCGVMIPYRLFSWYIP